MIQGLSFAHARDAWRARQDIAAIGLAGLVSPTASGHQVVAMPSWVRAHAFGLDTLGLAQTLDQLAQAEGRHYSDEQALDREIVAAMLVSPTALRFPSVEEWRSAVCMRRAIALAAAKTALAFQTEAAERPEDCWVFDEDRGFLLKPGSDLIEALIKATQPEATGRLYDFSCYRATEYVILLGMAQELRRVNPALYERLQVLSESQVIRSGRFHDVFLVETGSMDQPMPQRYYIPGDRVWFRNPHEPSSNVAGYEGSWVIYLGGGQFCNFWERNHPFTLETKAVEVYHWRDGFTPNCGPDGDGEIDEARVAQAVAKTLADPVALQQVLEQMLVYRDPKGVYAHGGCLDTTREAPRMVRPKTSDIVLPSLS